MTALRRAPRRLDAIVSVVAEHYARGAPVETIESLMAALLEAHSRIATVVIQGLSTGWPAEPTPTLHDALETNFFAPALLTRKLLLGMLERGHGAVLNVVTSGARCALPLFSEYAASKGALWAFSESLQRELAGTGVTVTTFVPPHMETTTRRRLGRKALAYFKLDKALASAASAAHVGEDAVAALAAGRHTVVPFHTRLQSALNALFPGLVAKRIQRSWRGCSMRLGHGNPGSTRLPTDASSP